MTGEGFDWAAQRNPFKGVLLYISMRPVTQPTKIKFYSTETARLYMKCGVSLSIGSRGQNV